MDKMSDELDCDFPQHDCQEIHVSDEFTICCICSFDLHSEIYVCGNGLHHYCKSCIDRMSNKTIKIELTNQDPLDSLISLIEQNQDDMAEREAQAHSAPTPTYPEVSMAFNAFEPSAPRTLLERPSRHPRPPMHVFREMVREYQGLNAESVSTNSGSRTSSRKRKHVDIQLLNCAFCCQTKPYVRLRSLEQLVRPAMQTCTSIGCTEKFLPSRKEEHVEGCKFRPFECLWCHDYVDSFHARDIHSHLMNHHYFPQIFTETRGRSMIFNLSTLQEEGDVGFFYYPKFIQSQKQTHEFYLFLRLHTRSPNGDKTIGIDAIDFTHHFSDTDIKNMQVGFNMELRIESDSSISLEKQSQKCTVNFQPYQQHMITPVYLVGLLPHSQLIVALQDQKMDVPT